MNAITEYLDELSPRLRRDRRRRILAEVRAHLIDATAAELALGGDPEQAAAHAIERFGPTGRVACQFNAVRRRPRAIAQRLAAVALASAATASLGTATVWAFAPGAGRSGSAQHLRAEPLHAKTRP